MIKTNIKVSDLPEIKTDFVEGALELLSMPEFCGFLGIISPLRKEPEAIADYFQLLRRIMLKKRQERNQQHAAQKSPVSQRMLLWNYGAIQIRQILQSVQILSFLGSHLLSFSHDQKPSYAWQKGLLVLLSFFLFPYLYFRSIKDLCQQKPRRTYITA